VKLSNGKQIKLSSGKHNEVRAAIVHNFASRFANAGSTLYLGDAAKKDLFVEIKKLGIPIDRHSKLSDVVIYDEKKN
jgi:type II restriction enzyme